ncbi:MAG: hypothetical protein LBR67_11160 [Dysgonamonadaceae bacterium]|jgi:hypothetical protein|nr:hypothetical protein [Dysgonamonadaceae bacterium]
MTTLKIAGVRRDSHFSPNHIGNDAAIFNLTVEHLKKAGCRITEYSETEFLEKSIDEEIIINMARDKMVIRKLQEQENDNKLVINSGYGIDNCTREKMTRLLIDNQIPHPKSMIVSTDQPLPVSVEFMTKRYWIKRGDFHAIHREDVTYTRNIEEAETVLNEYALRGIRTAVLNEHLIGDLIKFYGVAGTNFFYWFYPNDLNHSKFGWEKINGQATGIPFDLNYLKQLCNRTAEVLNIDIYGGDCVVGLDGDVKIIDFNDWPSFAPCRSEAAPYIAQCIYSKATVFVQQQSNMICNDR